MRQKQKNALLALRLQGYTVRLLSNLKYVMPEGTAPQEKIPPRWLVECKTGRYIFGSPTEALAHIDSGEYTPYAYEPKQ